MCVSNYIIKHQTHWKISLRKLTEFFIILNQKENQKKWPRKLTIFSIF